MQEMLVYAAGKIKRNFVMTLFAALVAKMLFCAANPVCCSMSIFCMLSSASLMVVTAIQFCSGILCCFCRILRWETLMTERKAKFCVFPKGMCVSSIVGKRVFLWHIPFMRFFVERPNEED